MTLREQFKQHPMTWRDYISALGVLVTIGTMLVQGGRLIEEVKTTNANVTALRTQVTTLQGEAVRVATELERQRGVDAVHDEQLRSIRRDVDNIRVRGGR